MRVRSRFTIVLWLVCLTLSAMVFGSNCERGLTDIMWLNGIQCIAIIAVLLQEIMDL